MWCVKLLYNAVIMARNIPEMAVMIRAILLFRKYTDQILSLTDCTSAVQAAAGAISL